ncbi:NUDIX domain-containing protein [Streptomyces sp. NPDC048106]|uniref:NUDIX domain-containing protein n=1 Tax=Streptomyces sp. NPDC048106 TaxID=3155750 RepID=UPI003455FA98
MENLVRAVVVYDGRLLLVRETEDWELPSGTGQPAETAKAAAARVVYELTGYLADGSATLDGASAVVCQLLSEGPSEGARLAPARVRWTPIEETVSITLPPAVRDYIGGHTPV